MEAYITEQRRDVHLFDEVMTAADENGWNHFLSCDACSLMVEVGRISDQYIAITKSDNRKEIL